MKRNDRPDRGTQVKWAMGALGIVLGYLGAFALLMYPVVQATGGVA
jgi:hypothetical protein